MAGSTATEAEGEELGLVARAGMSPEKILEVSSFFFH